MNVEVANEDGIVRCNTFHEALLYCQFYEQDGKRDWRLPTNEELDEWHEKTGRDDDVLYWADTDSYTMPLYAVVADIWVVAPIRDVIDEGV
jgi:hypothetical protein